jgi:pyruvate,water dikinase
MLALVVLSLTWPPGGPPLGPHHWPPIVARRRELLERLGEWTPPPALGRMPEAVNDPIVVMLWGITPQRLKEWAGSQEGSELNGAAASPGEVEGPARVLRGLGDLDTVRPGEILVCTITSPAWAPIFSKIAATVTDIGGIMSHAAIVSREYGLPAVVGTGTATSRITTGQLLRVNGSDGRVTILDEA